MTLKYESELLFDLMKRDGDNTPSDVLPYESELKEKYLKQVEGAYPKLIDYRSEWLNYNLNNQLPADFPMETLSNVTNATVHNVVPYEYGSAILKGNTSYKVTQYSFLTGKYLNVSNGSLNDGLSYHLYCEDYFLIPKGTQITLRGNNNYKKICYYDVNKNFISGEGLPTELFTDFTTVIPSNAKYFRFNTSKTNISSSTADYLKIYIDDDLYLSNEEYIQEQELISVKMPVLTTSNEDGTKTNILTVNEDIELRGIGDVKDELNLLTGEVTKRIKKIVLDGSQNMHADAQGVYIQVDDMKKVWDYRAIMTCDKLPVFYQQWDLPKVENGIAGYRDTENKYLEQNWIYFKVNNSIDVDEVRQILTQNPITVQYKLSVESIKTVDLNCINEQGESVSFRPIEGTMHVSTSSHTIPPLLDMSVPVEATTQNLMSFANIEEEE